MVVVFPFHWRTNVGLFIYFYKQMLLTILDHAGLLLLDFLDASEKRDLCVVGTAFAACVNAHTLDFRGSFTNERRWSTVTGRCHNIQTLQAFPNTIGSLDKVVNLARVHTLSLDNCGLTHFSIRTSGLSIALKRARCMQDFSVNENPEMRTSGLSRLLHSLGIAGARLRRLCASNTGVRSLYQPESPLLQDLVVLDLSKNALLDVQKDICKMRQLRELYVCNIESPPSSLTTLSWCRGSPALVSSILSSETLVRASLASFREPLSLVCDAVLGRSLRELVLSEVTLSAEHWRVLLRNVATHTRIEELVLCKAGNLSGESLGTFVQHLPLQTSFRALGLRQVVSFTYHELEIVLEKCHLRGLRLTKWILQDCGSLRLPPSSTSFLRTVDVGQPLHLDIRTRATLCRRDEFSWISSVLSAATFSYLGLGGRSVLLADIPANFLADTVELSLESAEINWGLGTHMTRLRTLSLYNVDSRYLCVDFLVEQALHLPIRHLRLDYCRLDDPIRFANAVYLHTLDANWCHIGDGFRNALLHAIVEKKFPALSSLGVMGTGSRHASFICLLLLAMKGGKRRCSVDARGLQWTTCQLRFLEISLKQIHSDDVSRLRINVREDARSDWRRMCARFAFFNLS